MKIKVNKKRAVQEGTVYSKDGISNLFRPENKEARDNR